MSLRNQIASPINPDIQRPPSQNPGAAINKGQFINNSDDYKKQPWTYSADFLNRWQLPGIPAWELWQPVTDDEAKKVGGCFKTGRWYWYPGSSKTTIHRWPCNDWGCSNCSDRMAQEYLDGTAECLSSWWTSEYVCQVHKWDLTSHKRSNPGSQNLYVTSFETTDDHKRVLGRLGRQVSRLRKKHDEVEYFAVHGTRTWWIASTVPVWTAKTGRGRPVLNTGTGQWVPPEVALTWLRIVMTLSWTKGWSRSQGWEPTTSKRRQGGDKPEELGTTRLVVLDVAKAMLEHHLLRLSPVITRSTSYVKNLAREVQKEALEFLDLPPDTACIQCQKPLGDNPSLRTWTPDGALCHRDHSPAESGNSPDDEATDMSEVLASALVVAPLREGRIEQVLHDAGFTVWFSSDEFLLKEALAKAGATYDLEDGRWKSISQRRQATAS